MNERPNRDYIIWIFGGAYLLYLAIKMGRSLLQGPIELRECFFPILFAVAGAFFLVKGVKRLKREREREASQALKEDDNADEEKDDNADEEKDDNAEEQEKDL